MEFRVLRYFLTVCQEESISNAAEVLHLTQPTLSRQLKKLEEEFGKKLFIRGNRKITLTPEGMFLQQRAKELLALESDTTYRLEHEAVQPGEHLCIGSLGQADLQCIMPAIQGISQTDTPAQVHLSYGNTRFLLDQLDSGLLDFAMVFEPFDHSRYSFMELPQKETWNVVMQKEDSLADSDPIKADALVGKTVYYSTDAASSPWVAAWFGSKNQAVRRAGTFSLRETSTTSGMPFSKEKFTTLIAACVPAPPRILLRFTCSGSTIPWIFMPGLSSKTFRNPSISCPTTSSNSAIQTTAEIIMTMPI